MPGINYYLNLKLGAIVFTTKNILKLRSAAEKKQWNYLLLCDANPFRQPLEIDSE